MTLPISLTPCCLPQLTSAPKIIEDYIEEVSRGLAFVASTDCQCLDKQQKLNFSALPKAFGQPP